MKLHALLAALVLLLFPFAGAAAGEPPAAQFAENYELVLELEMPGATARQSFLLAAPRFQADLGLARFEGKLTPAGDGRALLDYEAHVLPAAREGRPAERLRWRASVLLAHGVRTAFVATHDTTIRATVRPAP